MSLAPGTRLGAYEIVSALGAGGMGEVYRARDTRLGRTVALKVLPTDSISSETARARFQREAKVVSQLSHPHICTLFDVGQDEGIDFLVMELVEGETLHARLGSGPLPVAEVIRLGAQIADALDRAHRQGIVHRDLKPGNVMLTRSGIKLLDFGLARTLAVEEPVEGLSGVNTATAPMTAAGTVLGTLQYMAPEQLEGRPADSRSDIFALGCVLYEMLTARRAFDGPTAAAVASEILKGDVASLGSTRADCPPALASLVEGCLARDPDDRWQSAHDVARQLGALATTPAPASMRAAPASRWRWAPWVVAAVAFAVAVFALVRPRPEPPPAAGPVRFALPPPEGHTFAGWSEAVTFSISPDGRTLAFVAVSEGVRRLYLRSLSSLEAQPLEGTDGAMAAFWSPDGKSLGFFADRKLKRLDIGSGAPVTICSVRPGAGITGTWGSDGQILFASIEGEAIFRVPAAGGDPEPLIPRDLEAGVQRVVWPSFLPDGRRFLYLVRRTDRTYRIFLAGPDGRGREVRSSNSFAHYVDPGYLLFAVDGTLLAQRFSAETGQVSGDPIAITESVACFSSTGFAAFAVSRSGVLAYASGGDRARLAWFDGSGHRESLDATASMLWVRITPDGTRALFNRPDPRTGNLDIWALDLTRGVESRVTTDPGTETWGLVLPDGSLVYSDTPGPSPQLFRRDPGAAEPRALVPAGSFQQVQDVTPDAKTIVYAERIGYGAWDLFSVPAEGGTPTPLLTTPFDEGDLRLSPDGRLAAFVSTETGRPEVFVSPFPRLDERVRVSQGGAYSPRWSHGGSELFYVSGDRRLMSVDIGRGTPPVIGSPRALFRLEGKYRWASFDVARDGRFLAIVPEVLASEMPLTVVVDALPGSREVSIH